MHTQTYRLESLDNKIKVYHSRRDVAVSRNSDRDSPFTPMASEIPPPPTRATAAPHALLPPEQEDSLLLNTPLSTPPDSSGEDGRTPGPSLNRGVCVCVCVCHCVCVCVCACACVCVCTACMRYSIMYVLLCSFYTYIICMYM